MKELCMKKSFILGMIFLIMHQISNPMGLPTEEDIVVDSTWKGLSKLLKDEEDHFEDASSEWAEKGSDSEQDQRYDDELRASVINNKDCDKICKALTITASVAIGAICILLSYRNSTVVSESL